MEDSSSGGLNWASLVIVALGGILLIAAWQGTHRKLWAAITGKSQTSPSYNPDLFTPHTPDIIGSSACQAGTPGCPYTQTGNSYQQIAVQDAQSAGINPIYFTRQIQQESGFNPQALSPAGAEGIAQFMPSTAAGLGVNPWDPVASLKAAANLMASYINRFGSEAKALAAYNEGSGALQSQINTYGSQWFQHTPLETQNYINAIVGNTGVGNAS